MTTQPNSTETVSDPDGSIFLPVDQLTLQDIGREQFEMLAARGPGGELDLDSKIARYEALQLARTRLLGGRTISAS